MMSSGDNNKNKENTVKLNKRGRPRKYPLPKLGDSASTSSCSDYPVEPQFIGSGEGGHSDSSNMVISSDDIKMARLEERLIN